jgi:predicted acyltransferase
LTLKPTSSIDNSRLLSLDVFRGLVVAGMTLVTDPGTYGAVYSPLLHARWENPTSTDMIFSSFLVIAGIAIALSFDSRIRRGETRAKLMRKVILRSLAIFLLGLLLNGFPDYHLHTLRIPGVLQRIAICYLLATMLYLAASLLAEKHHNNRGRRRSVVIATFAVALLVLYGALLKLVPVPGFGAGRLDSLGNLGAYIDRAVFGIPHLWLYGTTPGYGVTFDPEGLLSTVPALATMLIGVIAGEWLLTTASQTKKVTWLTIAGGCLVLGGLGLSPMMPLIKKIWTPTFTLFSGGFALVVFSALYFVLDIKRWRRWASPALIFGTNAILAFTVSGVLTTLSDRIHITANDGSRYTLHQWGYLRVFATWLSPVHASLAYAIFVVAVNLVLIYPLYRRRVFLHL